MKRCIASEEAWRRVDHFDQHRKCRRRLPGVKMATVVGVFIPNEKERQLLVIERMPEHSLNEANVQAWLEPRLVKW